MDINNVILGCHLTGMYDVNRNTLLANDDFNLIQAWASSIAKQQIKAIVFHNNFSKKTIQQFASNYIQFIEVEADTVYKPNVNRYFIYKDYLSRFGHTIDNLFVTDITDVLLLQNPFEQRVFQQHAQYLFCGDEPTVLQNEWMQLHSTSFRNTIAGYKEYEEKYTNEVLLNCGIIGGNTALVTTFINELCAIHEQYNQHNTTAYTGDMGAFNFLVRTNYTNKILHGAPVNTVFKQYQHTRQDCWFAHK
jgi:hypothetical protein